MNKVNYKYFTFKEVFNLCQGHYSKIPDLYDNGDIPFFSAKANNYGIKGYINRDENIYESEVLLFEENAICVTNNGSVGYAYYVDVPFTCNKDVTVLYAKGHKFNRYTGNYIATIIMADRFRWNFGRKWKINRMKDSLIRLPVNELGYIDWLYMENFIKSLNIKSLTTNNFNSNVLNTESWKLFKLSDIFNISYGNKLDFNKQIETINSQNGINFVSRDSKNNGVVATIEPIENIQPYDAGKITVALGGSYLGTSFIQTRQFYTAQNIAVLEPKEIYKEKMNIYSKLFILPIIRFEAKMKYCAFGRELNTHIKNDFSIKLPVTMDGEPNWHYMETYIKALPFGDCV